MNNQNRFDEKQCLLNDLAVSQTKRMNFDRKYDTTMSDVPRLIVCHGSLFSVYTFYHFQNCWVTLDVTLGILSGDEYPLNSTNVCYNGRVMVTTGCKLYVHVIITLASVWCSLTCCHLYCSVKGCSVWLPMGPYALLTHSSRTLNMPSVRYTLAEKSVITS